MGAMGYTAFENDTAMDWMSFPSGAVSDVIEKTLRGFISGKRVKLGTRRDGVDHDEVMAAADLLDQLTPYQKIKEDGKLYTHFTTHKGTEFHLAFESEERGLYSVAVRALTKLLKDEEWLGCWDKPKAKREAVVKLRAKLAVKRSQEDRPRRRKKA